MREEDKKGEEKANARDSNTAAHCNTLQHTTTHCNALQHCNTSLEEEEARDNKRTSKRVRKY